MTKGSRTDSAEQILQDLEEAAHPAAAAAAPAVASPAVASPAAAAPAAAALAAATPAAAAATAEAAIATTTAVDAVAAAAPPEMAPSFNHSRATVGEVWHAARRGDVDSMKTALARGESTEQADGVRGVTRCSIHLYLTGTRVPYPPASHLIPVEHLQLGVTALLIASSRGHDNACCTLLKAGADPSATTKVRIFVLRIASSLAGVYLTSDAIYVYDRLARPPSTAL